MAKKGDLRLQHSWEAIEFKWFFNGFRTSKYNCKNFQTYLGFINARSEIQSYWPKWLDRKYTYKTIHFALVKQETISVRLEGFFILWTEDITKFYFYISVRSNGTNVEFEECTDIVHKNCPSLDRYNLQKKNCKKDHECTRLDKIFRCEDGMCWNITNVYRLVTNAL